jgi:riboflavin kinase/FMN adenylyltransferase
MQIWNSIEQAAASITMADTYSVVTIGNFDGVHRGHQAIIRRTVELAQAMKLLPVVFTFANHTDGLLGERPRLLNQPSIRRELLERQGLKALLEVEFDRELAELSPELFFKRWLVDRLRAQALVIGHDFKFGAGGSGDYRLLRQLGAANRIAIEQIPPVLENGVVVSSSIIRRLIMEGKIEPANRMLGYSFAITGEVAAGAQRGRSLGFPTANISLEPEYLLPAYGVYLTAFSVDGQIYYGVGSVGVKPTFGEHSPLIEVHLFDVTLDLYHKTVAVAFLKFIRPEIRFSSADALREQIVKDVAIGKKLVSHRDTEALRIEPLMDANKRE